MWNIFSIANPFNWNLFRKPPRPRRMPVNLMSKYVYVYPDGLREWLDTHVFGPMSERPGSGYHKIISEGPLEDLKSLFPDDPNPCEVAAFTLQYYLVDVLGYTYAHVNYVYPSGDVLLLTLKP